VGHLVYFWQLSLVILCIITDHVSDKNPTTPVITEWLRPRQQKLKIHQCSYQSLSQRVTFVSPSTSHPHSLPSWDFVNHTYKMALNTVNTKLLSDETQEQFLLWKKCMNMGKIWQYPSRLKMYYYSYRTDVFANGVIKMHRLF